MTLAIISHADCLLHAADLSHPERPARMEVIQDALKNYPLKTKMTWHEAPLVTHTQLIAAHDESYVNWIESIAPQEGMIGIDADTYMNPYSLQAAKRAAGAVCLAVDLVMQDKAQAVFCNVRPPGHHAERDKAMGFCIFNNVAVGVRYAMQQYQLERIAIIDFDVHHGNGTQHIFQEDERVLYCSSFEHPFYPGYDAELDNAHLLAVPLAPRTTSETFRERVKEKWFEALDQFKPQLVFFSAGFDAHANDPLADLQLHEADYVWLTKAIADIAKKHCGSKMISVLEGGYNLSVLAACVPAHVNAMLG